MLTHTLSQSILERVKGSALLKLLNVFSDISWYVSFSEIWYLLSSSSTSASIFDAAELSLKVIPGGRLKETSCAVVSWTSKRISWTVCLYAPCSHCLARNNAHEPIFFLWLYLRQSWSYILISNDQTCDGDIGKRVGPGANNAPIIGGIVFVRNDLDNEFTHAIPFWKNRSYSIVKVGCEVCLGRVVQRWSDAHGLLRVILGKVQDHSP